MHCIAAPTRCAAENNSTFSQQPTCCSHAGATEHSLKCRGAGKAGGICAKNHIQEDSAAQVCGHHVSAAHIAGHRTRICTNAARVQQPLMFVLSRLNGPGRLVILCRLHSCCYRITEAVLWLALACISCQLLAYISRAEQQVYSHNGG